MAVILQYRVSNGQRSDNKISENNSPEKGGITADMTVLDTVTGWKETQGIFQPYDALASECICWQRRERKWVNYLMV